MFNGENHDSRASAILQHRNKTDSFLHLVIKFMVGLTQFSQLFSFQLGTPWVWRAGGTGTAGSVSFQVSLGRVELEPQRARETFMPFLLVFIPIFPKNTSVWNRPETLETCFFLKFRIF